MMASRIPEARVRPLVVPLRRRPNKLLRLMLKYRHGISAWTGLVDGELVSMFTSAPR